MDTTTPAASAVSAPSVAAERAGEAAAAGRAPAVLTDHAHRQLIGYIGLLLPVLLVIVAGLRPTEGLPAWRTLDSISAYYYSGAVAAFVGMLVALALFLFTYRGYPNEYHWADRAVSVVAGAAALGVAFFPTAPPAALTPPTWWRPATGVLHYASAAVLFISFIVFALWLFRKTKSGAPQDADKRWRNRLFLVCGLVMVGAVAWAGWAGATHRPLFLPESIALVAFAISWLVKGYAHVTVASAVRKLQR